MGKPAGTAGLQTGTTGNAGLQTGTAARGGEPHGASRPDGATSLLAHIKIKHHDIWDRDPSKPPTQRDLALRTYRAVSWFERAEGARESDDFDVAFILYWIAFDAAYGQNSGQEKSLASYFKKLIRLDDHGAIIGAIGGRFYGPVRDLLGIPHLYPQFWDEPKQRGGKTHWKKEWEDENDKAGRALDERGDAAYVLEILFRRLYTLRNQLVHGAATWDSSRNRDSVEYGAKIMSLVLPVFLGIMLEHRNEDWGVPSYPPGDQGRQRAR